MAVHAVVVPVRGVPYPVTIRSMCDVEWFVGRPLETVPVRGWPVLGYIDAEAKLAGRPYNSPATRLARIDPADWIAGPMVILGRPDAKGNATSIPEELVRALTVPS